MRRSIVVYGNCQAGVFAGCLKFFGRIADRYSIHYVKSFDHPTESKEEIPATELAACVLVLEQLDSGSPMPQWLANRLPETAMKLRFPPLDFNLLWPLNFNDPRNVSEPPDYPFGRFPYGDRIVVELLNEGLTGARLWEEYQSRSVKRMPNLDRLASHETQRLATRDGRSDIKIGDLVMANFSEVPLFWTINHPTGWLLGRVLGELLYAARESLELEDDPRQKAKEILATFEPFAHQQQPIHPEVARQLGLGWWTP